MAASPRTSGRRDQRNLLGAPRCARPWSRRTASTARRASEAYVSVATRHLSRKSPVRSALRTTRFNRRGPAVVWKRHWHSRLAGTQPPPPSGPAVPQAAQPSLPWRLRTLLRPPSWPQHLHPARVGGKREGVCCGLHRVSHAQRRSQAQPRFACFGTGPPTCAVCEGIQACVGARCQCRLQRLQNARVVTPAAQQLPHRGQRGQLPHTLGAAVVVPAGQLRHRYECLARRGDLCVRAWA
jgi:hypothetical protein